MPVHLISFSVSRLLQGGGIKVRSMRRKTMERSFTKGKRRRYLKRGFILLLIILASGCSLGAKPAYLVNQYTLEYTSPVLKEMAQINELIKVERFSTAQAFDSLMMVYKEGPNLRNVDAYNRWRTKPGDMVTDNLSRDLRNSGLFRAVFSYNNNEETRYLLEGQVDEFLEVDEKDGRKAILTLSVTFLDLKKEDTTDKVIFQRDYRFIEPFAEKTPEAFAKGMSRAMEKFSKQVISDIFQAIKNR
jgi:ABC-type uncharacterized transport system auxiliary subunit